MAPSAAFRRARPAALALALLGSPLTPEAHGQQSAGTTPSTSPAPADLAQFQKQLDQLQQQIKDKDRRLAELEQKVKMLSPDEKTLEQKRTQATQHLLDDLLKEQDKHHPDAGKTPHADHDHEGGLRIIDISVDVLLNSGSSSASDAHLQQLQGGAHDPRKRGFTLSQLELSFAGAVDPYLNGEVHLVFNVDPITGETGAELEEAFLTTQTLPYGLQLKAGQYFTEFGRINSTHPHAWDWIDQPVINTRVFGPDGLRQTGARIAWLTPLPWFSELYFGIQNAGGETTQSFLASEGIAAEQPLAGRPFTERSTSSLKDMLYSMRWLNSWELAEEWTAQVGTSALHGPNFTGDRGSTWIYGGDVKLKWQPARNERGYPFVIWQTEILRRDFDAAPGIHPGTDGSLGTLDDVALAGQSLHDWGLHTQVLWGFTPDWAAGIRYEYATGSGDGVDGDGASVSHNADPFRDSRHRISPMLQWQPTHFSRLRLQYNYDRATHLDKDAHSVWLGVEFLFGAHPAHNY